jgi:hypothetical protein
MFPGAKLQRTVKSTGRQKLVAYLDPCVLLLKPSRNETYRVRFWRSQRFAADEERLVAAFVEELSKIADFEAGHLADLMSSLPRRMIAQFLPGVRGRTTLERALHRFEALAAETYEGRPVVAALGISGSVGHGNVRLEDLWKDDFARVLSNGFDSMYLCGSDGRVFNLKFLDQPSSVAFSPNRLGSIAAWCGNSYRVALVLNRNGEVLVFKEKTLQFAKRRGAWRYYPHDSVVSRLRGGSRALRRAVYESCLDVSFGRTGGCLAVLTASNRAKLAKYLEPDDLIANQSHTRAKLLSSAIKRPFQSLDRRFRQELLSLDGATVLTHTGEVLTSGSIVKVPGGSTAGGRKAAALQLSRLGLGIKISADGPITGFLNKQEIFRL